MKDEYEEAKEWNKRFDNYVINIIGIGFWSGIILAIVIISYCLIARIKG